VKSRRTTVWRSALMVAALALGTLVGTAPANASDSSCPVSGTVCFWQQQNYQGRKEVRGNIYEGTWVLLTVELIRFNSVKNRFTDRVVWTKMDAQNRTCTPAGGERPTAPGFIEFYVGARGSRC
jgi:hypothetical protein